MVLYWYAWARLGESCSSRLTWMSQPLTSLRATSDCLSQRLVDRLPMIWLCGTDFSSGSLLWCAGFALQSSHTRSKVQDYCCRRVWYSGRPRLRRGRARGPILQVSRSGDRRQSPRTQRWSERKKETEGREGLTRIEGRDIASVSIAMHVVYGECNSRSNMCGHSNIWTLR
jgi:hypothetical protein